MSAAEWVDFEDDDATDALADDIGGFYDDPLGFVMYVFPWGVPGTDLEHQDGPDEWQRQFLLDLGDEIKERGFNFRDSVAAIRMAVGSGHGIGKSALVAWLILFIMSTRPFCRGSVTASTVGQLQTKTIPELSKWHKRSIVRSWFRVDTTKIVHVDHSDTWRADFLTARKENSEAFAGQHAADATSFYIMDESSGVPDEIFEVAEGGLTDGEPMMFCFGNRTKATGRFNDFFGKLAHRWLNYCIDSRRAKMTNKTQIEEWRQDWGEDSDFFRVRVMGLAPKASAEQLIPVTSIEAARKRPAIADVDEPFVIGVDVARFGDDRSVIFFRKGNDARTHAPKVFRGLDTMGLANEVAKQIREFNADAVFVDGGGVGGGVVDRLNELGFTNIIEVNFGGRSTDREFFNKRSEMWGKLRDELARNLAIPDDDELQEDLVVVDYMIDPKSRTTRLISKEDMRRLGMLSTDMGDALALTYAEPVARRVDNAGGAAGGVEGSKSRDAWHPHDVLDD